MKILKSWLQDYVDIKEISDSVLDDKITFSGIEVEDIIKSIDDKVVVAEIKKIDKHPNADRLRLATVFDGTEEQVVVCGAPNIEEGQKVPLAKVGAILPGNFELKKAVIRGIESNGMICAEDELGLGENHDGIIILPADTEVGKKFNEIAGGDTIFDLKPTPNRGDCFSHLGIAREIAAVRGQKVKEELSSSEDLSNLAQEQGVEMTKQSSETVILSEDEGSLDDSDLLITIADGEACTSYFGAYIKGIKIEPSPDWIQKRLISVGAKPINNIVDITNYIMLDLGQPLHAFDATKVSDHSIIVRRAKEMENIVTLDGEIRNLTPDNLVIADSEKAIAIAGVMGGQNSEISNQTTDIILESAVFSPVVIRKSSKILNLSTEASYRYERGVDPLGAEKALKKAAKMITEIAGGEVADIENAIGQEYVEKKVPIEFAKIDGLLGLGISEQAIGDILTSLGFTLQNKEVIIPSWRRDVSIWQDLAEEVGRIYDLNNIKPEPLPKAPSPVKSDYYKKEFIKDILVDSGFTEVATYSVISEEDAKTAKLETSNLLELANPVQPENKYMRNSLIPGLLKTVAKNPTFDPILIFEVGNVFTKETEQTNIALASSGKNAKKLLESALEAVKTTLEIEKTYEIKELARDELERYKIRKPVTYFVELNTAELIKDAQFECKDLSLKLSDKNVHYRPLSKFPSLTRDLAFILDNNTDADQVADAIYEVSALINRVELFDEFSSDKFGENKKNIAFHLYLQHPDRTLNDVEADEIMKEVINIIEEKFNATLRDK